MLANGTTYCERNVKVTRFFSDFFGEKTAIECARQEGSARSPQLRGMRILILNGPNLNLLGKREPGVYGSLSFDEYLVSLRRMFAGHEIAYAQSNVEGELIDLLHGADGKFDGVVLNAGGYTHTSVAMRDAVAAIAVPVVEVHISNVMKREEFRHTSLLTGVCVGIIAGFGMDSYRLAIEALMFHAENAKS